MTYISRLLLIAAVATATAMAVTGCGGSKSSTSALSVDPQTLEFGSAEAATLPVKVTSSGQWTISAADSWCSTDVRSGSGSKTVNISVEANNLTTQRSTTVTFNGGETPATLTVVQAGNTSSAVTPTYAKGADLGWSTEMKAKGYKFYNAAGTEMECTALFKSLGFNSVRYRVWVNPSDYTSGFNYNSKADVLTKCRLAKAQGMSIMIDFHYSDYWADPGKQIIPSAWQSLSAEQIATKVGEHTKDVLNTLKVNGIDVAWVQVGNEVTNGMLRHLGREGSLTEASTDISGKVAGSSINHFGEYFKAGSDAVKSVYPDAIVILHIDNAWKSSTLTWFYNLMKANNITYDMIGLSLYPSYWDGSAYPDWSTKVKQAIANIKTLNSTYGKPVMFTEFGMPASEPDKAKAALQYIIDNTKSLSWFKGVFYWEPESEKARNGYDYGAFADGMPTAALDPFAN